MKGKTEYLKSMVGRKIDTDGVPNKTGDPDEKYQCADLVKDYLKQCFNVKGFSFTLPNKNPFGYARSLYENFDDYPALQDVFVRIKNTKSFVPAAGDIIVWTEYKGVTGKAGHVAVCMPGEKNDTSVFYSLDQNWSNKHYCTVVRHSYRGVVGVLRPLLKCTIADLNVRAGAGVMCEKVGELPKGTLVKPLNYKNGWAQIGTGRWVSAKYID